LCADFRQPRDGFGFIYRFVLAQILLDVWAAEAPMSFDQSAIKLCGVVVKFASRTGVVTALRDLSFDVKRSEFVSLVGPSGCGKSTCLGLVAGLRTPTRGDVFVEGRRVNGPSRNVGFMLQKDLLMPWRTVLENVIFGLELRGKAKAEMRDLAESYLRSFGLLEFANAKPSHLSGGMRQRISLIRTLLTDPKIILLDEPFSALDFQTRLILEDEIWSLLKSEGRTVVLITHDINEAIAMSDRILVMSKRPGTLKREITVELARVAGSPLEARNRPEFGAYFADVWKTIDVDFQLRAS
jgi:NitT/TauT family transport system ATP-binding protein